MLRLITLSGILRDGILLLVGKYRLTTSTQYQGREKDEIMSRKLNSSLPRPTFAENKGKRESISFLNQNTKQGEIHSVKRKRDENGYDVKNGIQKTRQNNGFADNHNHDNEHSNHKDGRSNRVFLDDDGDGGDDENEYLNQERQKVPYLGRNNNTRNNVRKTVNVKNQNWEDDDEDADDDIGYSDRGRISSANHLLRRETKKTVGGRDSGREYDDINGHENENERGKGKGSGGGGIGDDRYRQNGGARGEDREGHGQGQGGGRGQGGERGEGRGGGRGQGQEEGKGGGEGEGVGDSVESVMVWAMALVGESVLPCI